MANEYAINPATGRPAKVVMQYQDQERSEIENDITATDAELSDVTAQHDAIAKRKAELESQLADHKSNLGAYDEVASTEAGLDSGTTGGSSSEENAESQSAEVSEAEPAFVV
jgi:septal ring factor EnvC (AmiA/AmiB activator)